MAITKVNPPSISILRGVIIPPYGGDTTWTNLASAFSGLSETMQSFVESLRGRHAMAADKAVELRCTEGEVAVVRFCVASSRGA